MLPTLSDSEHTKTVSNEWIESVQRLKNKPKKKAIQEIKKAIKIIVNGGPVPATEGEKERTEGAKGAEA